MAAVSFDDWHSFAHAHWKSISRFELAKRAWGAAIKSMEEKFTPTNIARDAIPSFEEIWNAVNFCPDESMPADTLKHWRGVCDEFYRELISRLRTAPVA
jgi:hypothetical protein